MQKKYLHLQSRNNDNYLIQIFILSTTSPDGGIGRRAGLKHQWETVPVRARLRVQKTVEIY